MSKMRLKPATIGVVRSCATPHAVKHAISAMNSTSMPLREQRLALYLLRLPSDGVLGGGAQRPTLLSRGRCYMLLAKAVAR